MSDANPDQLSAQSDAPAGKHSKWDWFFAYGAALVAGSSVFILAANLIAETLRSPVGLALLQMFAQVLWVCIVLSVPIWLIGWPLAFGMRYVVGRFFGESRLSFVLTGFLASQIIFGLFGVNLPKLVFMYDHGDFYTLAVSQILAGAAGGWTWWIVENRLRRARAAKAAAKCISTADQNP